MALGRHPKSGTEQELQKYAPANRTLNARICDLEVYQLQSRESNDISFVYVHLRRSWE